MVSPVWAVIWVGCGLVTLVAAGLVIAGRGGTSLGRWATGILFTAGGALVHVVNLIMGVDYATFADTSFFTWVTDAWRAVVAPNQVFFIGLLAVFEGIVGALALSGGRRVRLAYIGVIGFYSALWLFGWFTTVWSLLMLPPVVILLWAEVRAEEMTDQPEAMTHRHSVTVR
ncbi:MAG TPA: hypothetical protein VK088_07660 [Acidimicrobiia bacterium]|nr:hypothetical protein [Acidimicrobiia bacterium]